MNRRLSGHFAKYETPNKSEESGESLERHRDKKALLSIVGGVRELLVYHTVGTTAQICHDMTELYARSGIRVSYTALRHCRVNSSLT